MGDPNRQKVNLQTESMLFGRLPQELRDQIYAELFSSTRFAFGYRPPAFNDGVRIKPAPYGLALLRTCRRAQQEIGDSWLGYVLFCFEDVKEMLDKLSALPHDTISKIRHLRINDDMLFLRDHTTTYTWWHHYGIPTVFKLLPGLQLDQRTVVGSCADWENHKNLNSLIRDSNGWKTLRCFYKTSAAVTDDLWIEQPKGWREAMERRDGAASNPSVAVYCTKEPAAYHESIFDPSKGERFEGCAEERGLEGGQKGGHETMVIVKRGSGADYAEKKDSPYMRIDLRCDWGSTTWKVIREWCINQYRIDNCEKGVPIQVDVYDHVDEYAWTPFHFSTDLRYGFTCLRYTYLWCDADGRPVGLMTSSNV